MKPFNGKERAMTKRRRRFKPTCTLEERLAEDTRRLQEQACSMQPGPALDHLHKRLQQNQAALDLSELLRLPRLQPQN